MNYLLILSTVMLFGFANTKNSPNSFEYRLTAIVQAFKQEIMNKEECEKLKRDTYDLNGAIADALKTENEYTPVEKSELENLKKEAEALEAYIGIIGNCGGFILTKENFELANRRIGGTVVSVIKNKYCVDVITVTIGDYVTYLGENNLLKNYKIAYSWKVIKGINTGSGTMGLMSKTVRGFYDNREKPSQKKISVFGITCNEF